MILRPTIVHAAIKNHPLCTMYKTTAEHIVYISFAPFVVLYSFFMCFLLSLPLSLTVPLNHLPFATCHLLLVAA